MRLPVKGVAAHAARPENGGRNLGRHRADGLGDLSRQHRSTAGQDGRVVEGVLRVVQLNMDSLLSPRWVERRHEIVTWLDELDADVVCL
jgi:hypothetical protein